MKVQKMLYDVNFQVIISSIGIALETKLLPCSFWVGSIN